MIAGEHTDLQKTAAYRYLYARRSDIISSPTSCELFPLVSKHQFLGLMLTYMPVHFPPLHWYIFEVKATAIDIGANETSPIEYEEELNIVSLF